MSDRNITINILPQDPVAWIVIAVCAMFVGIAWTSKGDTNINIERERTRRIQMLADRGMTNAVIEEIKKDLEDK